ncbi:phospholipase, patatin family protein [Cardiosporidium cionae]|uniref:Phospholipase, patatin family protein n=1 Tax=Cardiosporidium cionae TaxID=476202 RepID=A0ABQ7JEY8_9APIC|nr:phospholipase, patatin family protein [Cardiosporidium cionae]|eukprot:KAF8822564.1 phospholipase, patatin family protein [Cardiosporidium cionae]
MGISSRPKWPQASFSPLSPECTLKDTASRPFLRRARYWKGVQNSRTVVALSESPGLKYDRTFFPWLGLDSPYSPLHHSTTGRELKPIHRRNQNYFLLRPHHAYKRRTIPTTVMMNSEFTTLKRCSCTGAQTSVFCSLHQVDCVNLTQSSPEISMHKQFQETWGKAMTPFNGEERGNSSFSDWITTCTQILRQTAVQGRYWWKFLVSQDRPTSKHFSFISAITFPFMLSSRPSWLLPPADSPPLKCEKAPVGAIKTDNLPSSTLEQCATIIRSYDENGGVSGFQKCLLEQSTSLPSFLYPISGPEMAKHLQFSGISLLFSALQGDPCLQIRALDALTRIVIAEPATSKFLRTLQSLAELLKIIEFPLKVKRSRWIVWLRQKEDRYFLLLDAQAKALTLVSKLAEMHADVRRHLCSKEMGCVALLHRIITHQIFSPEAVASAMVETREILQSATQGAPPPSSGELSHSQNISSPFTRLGNDTRFFSAVSAEPDFTPSTSSFISPINSFESADTRSDALFGSKNLSTCISTVSGDVSGELLHETMREDGTVVAESKKEVENGCPSLSSGECLDYKNALSPYGKSMGIATPPRETSSNFSTLLERAEFLLSLLEESITNENPIGNTEGIANKSTQRCRVPYTPLPCIDSALHRGREVLPLAASLHRRWYAFFVSLVGRACERRMLLKNKCPGTEKQPKELLWVPYYFKGGLQAFEAVITDQCEGMLPLPRILQKELEMKGISSVQSSDCSGWHLAGLLKHDAMQESFSKHLPTPSSNTTHAVPLLGNMSHPEEKKPENKEIDEKQSSADLIPLSALSCNDSTEPLLPPLSPQSTTDPTMKDGLPEIPSSPTAPISIVTDLEIPYTMEHIKHYGIDILLQALQSKQPETLAKTCSTLQVITQEDPSFIKVLMQRGIIPLIMDVLHRTIKKNSLFSRLEPSLEATYVAQRAILELMYQMVLRSDTFLRLLQETTSLFPLLQLLLESVPVPQYNLTLSGPRSRHVRIQKQYVESVRLTHRLLAALGLNNRWYPRIPGQKGLRILCLDGGGTRGVMTIAILKYMAASIGRELHEVFDIICGTSTGGIIALLLGAEKANAVELEHLYDALITEIFVRDSAPVTGARLVVQQAYYDASLWESILLEAMNDSRMIDSSADPSVPKIFFISSILSSSPLSLALWRNYNYPQNSGKRHSGSFRIKVRDALRATTAAPGFFSALRLDGHVFGDGAVLANNPTAVALSEAKAVYPDVPIELIVSLGTGKFSKEMLETRIGWDGIIQQLINSATNTEGIHQMLLDFLPKSTYFRFNPQIEMWPIDETRGDRLNMMKRFVERYFEDNPENKARLQELVSKINPSVEDISRRKREVKDRNGNSLSVPLKTDMTGWRSFKRGKYRERSVLFPVPLQSHMLNLMFPSQEYIPKQNIISNFVNASTGNDKTTYEKTSLRQVDASDWFRFSKAVPSGQLTSDEVAAFVDVSRAKNQFPLEALPENRNANLTDGSEILLFHKMQDGKTVLFPTPFRSYRSFWSWLRRHRAEFKRRAGSLFDNLDKRIHSQHDSAEVLLYPSLGVREVLQRIHETLLRSKYLRKE